MASTVTAWGKHATIIYLIHMQQDATHEYKNKVKIISNNILFSLRRKVMVNRKQVYAINSGNLNPYTFRAVLRNTYLRLQEANLMGMTVRIIVNT
jgi:hypothetical protein